MPRTSSKSPTCSCGYDLSGLQGPPWICPECAQVTAIWPPSDPLTFLARDLWQWRLSLAAVVLCPLAFPWIEGDIVTVYAIDTVLIVFTIMGTLVVASMQSHEYCRRHRISRRFLRAFLLVLALLGTAALCIVIACLSALTHHALMLPP